MDAPKSDPPKLPDMVMCGDHPSITKTELNVKTDPKMDKKEDKLKEKALSYAKITPSGSRTRSEHVLLPSGARRRVRELEVVRRPDVHVQAAGHRALVQVALGSFRWPPYLLCVWVLVLLLTHALHCLVCLLQQALPALRQCSQFFRSWTETSWRGELQPKQRALPLALGLVTALLHALYYALYAAYAVVLWAIEPLCADTEDKLRTTQEMMPKVTNYEDELKNDSS